MLQINEANYYVPVTSFKLKRSDNFLIIADSGDVVSSLRFNYMFPIPDGVIHERIINSEPDIKYRALLSQELRYCIKNQDTIRKYASRTYKRVLLGKDPGLLHNSCDFALLEEKMPFMAKIIFPIRRLCGVFFIPYPTLSAHNGWIIAVVVLLYARN